MEGEGKEATEYWKNEGTGGERRVRVNEGKRELEGKGGGNCM